MHFDGKHIEIRHKNEEITLVKKIYLSGIEQRIQPIVRGKAVT